MLITFAHPHLRIPAVGFDLAEKLIPDHHAGAAFTAVFEVDEFSIPKLIHPPWNVAWHDMRMNVDFQQMNFLKK